MVPVERAGLRVLGVGHQGIGRDLGADTARQGVGQQRGAQALAFEGQRHSQPTHADGRDGAVARQLAGDGGRQIRQRHTGCGKGVVALNLAPGGQGDKARGHLAAHVLADLLAQVAVERGGSAALERPSQNRAMNQYDVFISHASEDKLDVVRPLASLLLQAGLSVWIDEAELVLGDSLRRKIEQGLVRSSFGVVVLSRAFFAKEWPQKELDALVAREEGQESVILPVWHHLSASDVRIYSPLLADRLGTRTDLGLQTVAGAIVRAVRSRRSCSDGAAEQSVDRSVAGVRPADQNQRLSVGGPKRIDQLIVEFIDRVAEASDCDSEVVGVRTGFSDLDRLLSGLKPGRLYVVAARPSMGSTTFALNVVAHVATVEQLPVVYFSPLVSNQDLLNRLIASVGRIDRRRLTVGQLSDEEWKRLPEATKMIHGAPLYIDDTAPMTIEHIIHHSRATKINAGAVGLVVIDCFETLAPQQSQSKIEYPRLLNQLARELHCPVMLLVTASHAVDIQGDRHPSETDLPVREAIEQFATTILYLYRDDYYNQYSTVPGLVEVIVGRNRDGFIGRIHLSLMKAIGRMENITYDEAQRGDVLLN